ncbi:MAG: SGNH/GDSL hydrolase family protein [Acidobacteria bacterium]|nr:SGNH/GDSL hydrolase family protein [Acidobacteriota bacterium]
MKRLALSLLAAILAGPAAAVAPPKKTASKKTSAKKTTAPRRRTARPIPKAPPVSAKARAEASETVNETLARGMDAPLENPAAMVPFFELLYRAKSGEPAEPLRILHWGDSHTASDEWTGSLRALLQGQFGDGGGGYSLAGRPYSSYRRLDLRSGATRGWRSEGLLKREGDGLYGLGGVSVATRLSGQSVYLKADCRHLELFFLRQPGGGDFQFFDNGEEVERISSDGELGPGYVVYDAEPGPHRFEVKTLSRRPVRLFGWVTEKERGVTYETLGINGAQASVMFRWDESLLASHIERRNPALIVLAYGTNEAGNPDWTRESYRDMFAALLQRLRRAAPAASILVLGPPDRYRRIRGKWTPFERIDLIVAAQREAALANRCAFWDLREKMGGPGAMRQWVLAGLAQYDHVHFTAPGYRRLGYVLYRDLMYNYQKYTQAREELAGNPAPAEAGPAGLKNGQTNTDR